jgi:hypothetical protein
LRGEWSAGGFEDFRENAFLLSRVCHGGSLPSGGQASRPHQPERTHFKREFRAKDLESVNGYPTMENTLQETRTKPQGVIKNASVLRCLR